MEQKTIAEILGSEDTNEQARRAAELVRAATAPVVDLIIRVDGRTGKVASVDSVGGGMTLDNIEAALEQARKMIGQERLNIAVAKAIQEQAKAESAENVSG